MSGLVLTTLVGTLALSPAVASAAGRPLCVGTTTAPGTLSGDYTSGVRIEGLCAVNGGPAVVHGILTLTPGSALVAAFAKNDVTGKGVSKLTVIGGIDVQSGATLILGCEPNFFTCIDDPNSATGGTLSSTGVVRGNVDEDHALGVIIHHSLIDGNINEAVGGGGPTGATPTTGVWALFNSPVYSAYEDSVVHGNISLYGLSSCWLGVTRTRVFGNLRITNDQLADPDAIEILGNRVAGNLTCLGNSMTWDSAEASFGQPGLYPRTPQPNKVDGNRIGQCVLASPATQGGPPGPGPF